MSHADRDYRMAVIRFLAEQDPSTLQIQDSNGDLPVHVACQAGASIDAIRLSGGIRSSSSSDLRPKRISMSAHGLLC